MADGVTTGAMARRSGTVAVAANNGTGVTGRPVHSRKMDRPGLSRKAGRMENWATGRRVQVAEMTGSQRHAGSPNVRSI